MIGGILGWVAGLLFKGVGGTVLDRILNIVDRKVPDVVEREKIAAEVTKRYIDAEMDMATTRKEAFGGWAWVMAALFLPGPALWWNMVFIDSVFDIPNYVVLALPSAFYPWMTAIISAIFFIPTMNRIFKR
jgi:hypothetical protein